MSVWYCSLPCCSSRTHRGVITGAPLLPIWSINIIILTYFIRICSGSESQPSWAARTWFPLNTAIGKSTCIGIHLLQIRWRRDASTSLSNRWLPLILVLFIIWISRFHWSFRWVHLSYLFEELWDSVQYLWRRNNGGRDYRWDVQRAHWRVRYPTANLHLSNHARDKTWGKEWVRRWWFSDVDSWSLIQMGHWGLCCRLHGRGHW